MSDINEFIHSISQYILNSSPVGVPLKKIGTNKGGQDYCVIQVNESYLQTIKSPLPSRLQTINDYNGFQSVNKSCNLLLLYSGQNKTWQE